MFLGLHRRRHIIVFTHCSRRSCMLDMAVGRCSFWKKHLPLGDVQPFKVQVPGGFGSERVLVRPFIVFMKLTEVPPRQFLRDDLPLLLTAVLDTEHCGLLVESICLLPMQARTFYYDHTDR
jgi:hypothetical protein